MTLWVTDGGGGGSGSLFGSLTYPSLAKIENGYFLVWGGGFFSPLNLLTLMTN